MIELYGSHHFRLTYCLNRFDLFYFLSPLWKKMISKLFNEYGRVPSAKANDTKLVIICVQMEQNSLVEQTSIKYNIPRIWSNRWGKKTQHGCPARLDLYQTFLTKTHERTEERKQPFQCCYIYKPPTTDVNDKTDQRELNDTNNHTKQHRNSTKLHAKYFLLIATLECGHLLAWLAMELRVSFGW